MHLPRLPAGDLRRHGLHMDPSRCVDSLSKFLLFILKQINQVGFLDDAVAQLVGALRSKPFVFEKSLVIFRYRITLGSHVYTIVFLE